eukprot:Colp12_sorted_trinity150504_noHs@4633
MLSLSSGICTTFGGPSLVLLEAEGVPIGARFAMAFAITGFGVLSTAVMHYVSKPYILRLFYDAKTEELNAETLDLFARKMTTKFHVSEAKPAGHELSPFVSFRVKGKGLYVQPEFFENKDLLSRLTETAH